jgi:phosphomevalonate kinase
VRVLAPGKIVIVGEYAVLDGAPAVVAAVDRGVACEVLPASERRTTTPDGDARFVTPALDAAGAPAAHYIFSAWNPPQTATKAGLGGSAAATVAAVVAGRALCGLGPDPTAVHTLAHKVHHAVQGSGSGIDIAASAHGGVLVFQDGAVRSATCPLPVVVYAGTSAKTGPRIQQYRALVDRTGFIAASRAAVARFLEDPLGGLRDARRALSSMTDQAGIAYWTPGLHRIVELAEVHGGEAKPSGAGGGDSAVALFADDDARSSFVTACEAAGLQVIPTRLAEGAQARKE